MQRFKHEALRTLIRNASLQPAGFTLVQAELSYANAGVLCRKKVAAGELFVVIARGKVSHFFATQELATAFRTGNEDTESTLSALREFALKQAKNADGYCPAIESKGKGNSFLVCTKLVEAGLLIKFKFKNSSRHAAYYFVTQAAANAFAKRYEQKYNSERAETAEEVRLRLQKARHAREAVAKNLKHGIPGTLSKPGKPKGAPRKSAEIVWPTTVVTQHIPSKLDQSHLEDYRPGTGIAKC
jgi:hypothetical protein